MKIEAITTLEECLDGVSIKEYRLDGEVQRNEVDRFASGNRLEYFEFARPFYKIISEGRFTMKGVVGNRSVQVVYPSFNAALEKEVVNRLSND